MGFGLIKEGDPGALMKYMSLKASARDMKIDYVDWGIASRFDNVIVMNKKLAIYKKYCLDVFNHELRHKNKLTKEDLAMDAFEGSILTNLSFCLRHPKGLTQFIPFGKYNNKPFIDLNLILVYIILIILVTGFFIIF